MKYTHLDRFTCIRIGIVCRRLFGEVKNDKGAHMKMKNICVMIPVYVECVSNRCLPTSSLAGDICALMPGGGILSAQHSLTHAQESKDSLDSPEIFFH